MLRMATSCSSQVQQPERPCRPPPTAITFTGSAKTFSDRVATDYGSEGWGFESSERAQVNGPLLAAGVLGRAAAGLPEQLACV